jgi:hypothetical protein
MERPAGLTMLHHKEAITMDNLIGDKVRVTEAREGTDDEARTAISLIVSMIARGYQPEHVMGILTDAICQALVLFSPNEKAALDNFEGSIPNVKDCVSKNFVNQAILQEIFSEKVKRIMPMAVGMGMHKERPRG